ncbi:MAG: SIMPL domain-containing protein [Dehalococcoidia bacterium]
MKKIWLIVILGIVVMLLLATAGCDGKDTISYKDSQQTGLTVSGQGKVTAVPDLATLSLGIEAEAATVSEARAQAAAAMDKAMASLKSSGIVEKDIQTSQFSIYPVKKWDKDTEQEILVGYRVTNMVNAKLRELQKAGQIIDSVAQAGGDLTRIQGISFTVEDPTRFEDQAREKALADAKAKADQIARLTGVTLGKPISISESGGFTPPYPMVFAQKVEGAGFDAATSISAGEQEISVSVQIVYEID